MLFRRLEMLNLPRTRNFNVLKRSTFYPPPLISNLAHLKHIKTVYSGIQAFLVCFKHKRQFNMFSFFVLSFQHFQDLKCLRCPTLYAHFFGKLDILNSLDPHVLGVKQFQLFRANQNFEHFQQFHILNLRN